MLWVSSTSSSSAMNSTAFSSVSWIGGVSTCAVLAQARVGDFFSFTGLTTRSLSREWMPMIIPSYSGSRD